MEKWKTTVLPNFSTIGTISCFHPHKSAAALASDKKVLELLSLTQRGFHDELVHLKAQASHKRFGCAVSTLV